MFGNYWTAFLDIIYPPKCPACKTSVSAQGAWCQACLAKILSVRQINMAEHHLTALDSCRVVCEYTGGLKRLIHDMKFRQQQQYAIYLRWLIEQNIDIKYLPHIDYVIPIPLHAARLKERGYNQAEAIFKDWALAGKMPWIEDVLERTRHTIPQWELNIMERKQNIKGAFLIGRPEMVKNKHIMVVDDIITTGITLDECAKVIKKAGAASVHGLAVASGAR
ncbi:MAG: phosphoribosyltransferase [Firmicutes bacterium]|nr:phosphoribosyltransferase [Bacillota bacterium]